MQLQANSKYKCNGEQPCFNCRSFGAECKYTPSAKARAHHHHNQQHPFEAIELRLSELETTVASRKPSIDTPPLARPPHAHIPESVAAMTDDSIAKKQPRLLSGLNGMPGPPAPSPDSASDGTVRSKPLQSVTLVIRDMYLGCLSGCVGPTSDITMGRVINSMMQVSDIDMSEDSVAPGTEDNNGQWEHLSPKSASTAPGAATGTADFAQITDTIANKQFRGYILHISTRWPVLHTPYLRHLHENRASITGIFE